MDDWDESVLMTVLETVLETALGMQLIIWKVVQQKRRMSLRSNGL